MDRTIGPPRRGRTVSTVDISSRRYRRTAAVVKVFRSRSRVAEGEGFEPSRRLNTPYSLSRRALSAAQSSLRVARESTQVGAAGGYLRGHGSRRGTRRIATLLERARAGRYKEEAFRTAADADPRPSARRAARARRAGSARVDLPGVGSSTGAGHRAGARRRGARVPRPARGRGRARRRPGRRDPRRARRATATCTPTGPTAAPRIEAMARKAVELGHEYLALTDHSPRLTIAHGLNPERLREQLDVSRAQRGARAVPHPHRHRGRHPRGRLASTRTTTCSPSSTSSSPACTRSCAWTSSR